MPASSRSWEHRLILWAREAVAGSDADGACFPEAFLADGVGAAALERAYAHCRALTRQHSRTFYLTSSLLPGDKCRAVQALYAFCRISDDLVDGGGSRIQFDNWRRQALHSQVPGQVPGTRVVPDAKVPGTSCGTSWDERELVALAWADARARYRIPVRYAEQLIQGVGRDLDGASYETFEDLAAYCYGVASTVGLMSMHIVGFEGPEAIPYAVKLGVALQLTNILRDVGEDWHMGRLYLPRTELAAFGLAEEDIAQGCTDDRWQRFLAFQIERTRNLYTEALPGVAMLHRDGRFAIAAAAELYRDILDDIEAHGGDVFRRRAYVSTWGKLRQLPGIWWSQRHRRWAQRPRRKCSAPMNEE
jgi:15-cis-phytoene synthase